MKKMRRSEKYRVFRDYGVPRHLLLDEKDKKREQVFLAAISFIMFVLALLGRNEVHRIFGLSFMFLICLMEVFNR